jgi:hypothetical protein
MREIRTSGSMSGDGKRDPRAEGARAPAPILDSTHLAVEARHRPAIPSLRLLAVLTVLFKYASAPQAAPASY